MSISGQPSSMTLEKQLSPSKPRCRASSRRCCRHLSLGHDVSPVYIPDIHWTHIYRNKSRTLAPNLCVVDIWLGPAQTLSGVRMYTRGHVRRDHWTTCWPADLVSDTEKARIWLDGFMLPLWHWCAIDRWISRVYRGSVAKVVRHAFW